MSTCNAVSYCTMGSSTRADATSGSVMVECAAVEGGTFVSDEVLCGRSLGCELGDVSL